MKSFMYVLAAGMAFAGCKTTTKPVVTQGELIQVETTRCFGACPVFKMTINNDRTATYEAIKFNQNQEGTYTGTIKEKDFARLQVLIKRTNYANLQDTFRMEQVSDMPSITLHIPHEGKVKTIYDYGEKGTPQLEALYTFLTDLRTNQEWR